MKDGLYHKDVFLSTDILTRTRQELYNRCGNELYISRHLQETWNTDWNRLYPLHKLTFQKLVVGEIVEVEVVNHKIHKVLFRCKCNKEYDMCVAVAFVSKYGKPTLKVKTCWLNERRDTHRTLNTNKYVKGVA